MGWTPDPTFVIRPDLTRDASFPFPHSPLGSPQTEEDVPSSIGTHPYSPNTLTISGGDLVGASSIGTTVAASGTATHSASPPIDQVLSPATATQAPTNPTLLTLDAQKAGANSPSMADIIHMIDAHSPDILFLTETPLHTRNMALKRVLTNRGYCIHFHPANAPSPSGGLPEARIPTSLTHAGGGAWIAYKKQTPWSSMVRPLNLPADCPSATTCAVELTLLTGAKAAFIASYLPQPIEEHAQVCKALANLPQTLPHQFLILGGDLHGD
jgi:hypothetical protein